MKKLFTVLLILLVSDLFNAYSAYALPDRVKVTFHYKRTTPSPEGYTVNYDDYKNWNLWIWKNSDDNAKDKNVPSAFMHKGHERNWGFDNFGAKIYVVIEGTSEFKDIGFLLRKSTNAGDWAERDIEVDRFINKFDRKGEAEVWLVQGDPTVYYSHPSPDKDDLAKQQLKDSGLGESLFVTCLDGEEEIDVKNPLYDPDSDYKAGWWFKEEYLSKCVPVFWKISVDNDGFRKLHTMKIDPSETSGDLGNSTFNINCLNKRLNVYVPFEYANSYGFQGKGLYKIDNKKPVTFKYTQGRNLNGFFFDNPSGILNGLKIGKSEFILKVNNINGDAILKFPIADYAKAKSEFSKKSGCKLP